MIQWTFQALKEHWLIVRFAEIEIIMKENAFAHIDASQ
jgi:hypothetical protein